MRFENPESKRNQKAYIAESVNTKPTSSFEEANLTEVAKIDNYSKGKLIQFLESKKSCRPFMSKFNYQNYKMLEEERISKVYSKHFFEEAQKFEELNTELSIFYQARLSFLCMITRKEVLEKFIQLNYDLGLSSSTLFLMTRLFDMYLLKNNEQFDFKSKLSWYMKICSVCLLIASKNEDRYPVNIKKLVNYLKENTIEVEGR